MQTAEELLTIFIFYITIGHHVWIINVCDSHNPLIHIRYVPYIMATNDLTFTRVAEIKSSHYFSDFSNVTCRRE